MADLRKFDDQQKLLLEIIKRYDSYINSSNSKIAIILSYCMAYIGGLGFKLVDVSDKRAHDAWWWGLLLVSLASVGVTLWAARYAYLALHPQLPSGRASHEGPSAIFFGDVARHPGGRDGYAASLGAMTDEEVVKDLSHQAHTLAGIAAHKFSLLGQATSFIVHFQIPLFGVILAVLLTALQQQST
ncbi:Pycsar system effector family protein [Caballeronia sp. INDeC2]|uniref:Pycsar system effector family protein n=1 Tax=Caballeronia sp. INDeC2 TaxID=2921747 RepID=UPI002028E05F|nr:Pycsar system effector family protein [Caballeronia sp. INDeC2]